MFDPNEVAGWPAECRWDIVAGCDDPAEAMRRAAAMTAAKPLGRGGNAEFFADACRTVLRCLLHAAALIPDGSMREVMGWVRSFADDTPFIILRQDPRAEPGWGEDLTKYTRGAAPETVASTEMFTNSLVSSSSRQRVLDLVCPEPGQGFDVDAFVTRGQDTIYCLSEGGADVSTAPLVIVSAAKRASQRRPTRRLDPILTFVLDEAPNVAPLPDMQALLTDGGRRGLRTWVFAQSFGRLRARWGRDGADTLSGGTSLKLLFGGCTDTDDLERISRLCGDRWVRRDSVNRPDGWFSANQGSQHTSVERERRVPVDEISEMPIDTALLLYRSTVREKVTLPARWERPDAARFGDSVEQARQVTGRTPAPA